MLDILQKRELSQEEDFIHLKNVIYIQGFL